MYNSVIIRNGEVAIKGLNRSYFENHLVKNLKKALYGLDDYEVYKADGRTYVDFTPTNETKVLSRIPNVFGVMGYSPVFKTEPGYETAKNSALLYFLDKLKEHDYKSFKVSAKRENKKMNLTSPEIAKDIGGFILSHTTAPIVVDVHNPELHIVVEVRNNCNVIYSEKYDGVGGMPIGTNGRAMTLLSGGIDSPVATYQIAKRGLLIEAVHFHSFPFTGEAAQAKIERLAQVLFKYTDHFKIHMVNLLPIQKQIAEKCSEDMMTILSRRFMMRIAEKLALKNHCNSLVTGESIGQVASQTVEGLQCSNAAVSVLPVFRPLISWDKDEIIKAACKIGTFDISIIPAEDCCTVFLPKHPVTRPKLDKVIKEESALDVDELVKNACEESVIKHIDMI